MPSAYIRAAGANIGDVVISLRGKIFMLKIAAMTGKLVFTAANNNSGESAAISAELLILDAFISQSECWCLHFVLCHSKIVTH